MLSREARRISSRDKNKKKQRPEKKKTRKIKKKSVYFGFTIFILIIITIAFIGAPMVGNVGGRRHLIFGSYAGREIEYMPQNPENYFTAQYIMISRRMEQSGQSGQYGSPENQRQRAFHYAFNRTVLQEAIEIEAGRSGLWISDNFINDSLLEHWRYVDKNGVFNQKEYKNTPINKRNAIKKLHRKELIHSQYMEDMLSSYFQKENSKEIEFVKNMTSKERSFSL